VHAAIAKPDRGAVGDAAIVDLGEETLVVDTHFSSPSGARAAGRGGRAHRPAGGVGVEHALAQRPRARQRRVRGSDRRLHDADARADRHRGVERLAAQKQWLEAELPAELERLRALDWEACIPGQGPVSGREVVPPLRHYLLALDDAVLSDEPDPKLPAAFADWDGAEMWGRNLAALRER
jgi:hypothetical protein